ncbi:hypothetical protein H2O64_04220 [Kordia sp. YSTF-M3]|uniref:Uncharacterized protein n=1 Tax=Kordia aestuariivivens TaxID=2759037 RepID=A0ABR7Q5R3_9FLAO|nr:hypothetical protein [Kordia aestuariivivens]MBC8753862.1 hypothetical protein [Kordia aestuariivivens]
MQKHQPRTISFVEVVTIAQWKIKVYTISKEDEFNHPEFYKNAISQLPSWLEKENSFDASHNNIGFLILHAGTEGIFSLINWWVGINMMNTHIFLTPKKGEIEFQLISGDGIAPCIWEFEIINFERLSWIKHILKQHENPNYTAYLEDHINTKL